LGKSGYFLSRIFVDEFDAIGVKVDFEELLVELDEVK
jgi:hypothetical protein